MGFVCCLLSISLLNFEPRWVQWKNLSKSCLLIWFLSVMDSQSKISWQLIHRHCWKMLGGHYNKMFTASSLSSLQLIWRIYQKNFSLVEIRNLRPSMEMLMDLHLHRYTLQNCPTVTQLSWPLICFIARLYHQSSSVRELELESTDQLTSESWWVCHSPLQSCHWLSHCHMC